MSDKQHTFLEFGDRLEISPQTAVLIPAVDYMHKDGVQPVLPEILPERRTTTK